MLTWCGHGCGIDIGCSCIILQTISYFLCCDGPCSWGPSLFWGPSLMRASPKVKVQRGLYCCIEKKKREKSTLVDLKINQFDFRIFCWFLRQHVVDFVFGVEVKTKFGYDWHSIYMPYDTSQSELLRDHTFWYTDNTINAPLTRLFKERNFFPAGLRFGVPKCTDESRSKIMDFYAMKTSKVCRR